MESIRIWLNGARLYSSGVKLYAQYGDNTLLKRLFAEPGTTDFKVKKLSQALEVLVAVDSKESTKKVEMIEKTQPSQPFSAAPVKTSKGWSEKMDAVEAALNARWKPVFAEMMDLCSRVGDVAKMGLKDPLKKVEAGKMALRILDLDDECEKYYAQREHYVQHGTMPDAKPYGEPCIDANLIPVKLANAERYVREYKIKLAKDPADVKTAEQIKKHQWFVDHYKQVLKKD